jgi:hypothetical protein
MPIKSRQKKRRDQGWVGVGLWADDEKPAYGPPPPGQRTRKRDEKYIVTDTSYFFDPPARSGTKADLTLADVLKHSLRTVTATTCFNGGKGAVEPKDLQQELQQGPKSMLYQRILRAYPFTKEWESDYAAQPAVRGKYLTGDEGDLGKALKAGKIGKQYHPRDVVVLLRYPLIVTAWSSPVPATGKDGTKVFFCGNDDSSKNWPNLHL